MNASLVSPGWTWTLEPSCISDKKLLLFCLPAANVVWHEGNEGAWLMAQAQHVLSCESRQFLPITVQDHFDHKKNSPGSLTAACKWRWGIGKLYIILETRILLCVQKPTEKYEYRQKNIFMMVYTQKITHRNRMIEKSIFSVGSPLETIFLLVLHAQKNCVRPD